MNTLGITTTSSPPSSTFKNVALYINGGEVRSPSGIVYIPAQSVSLPILPPRKITCYSVICHGVTLAKVTSVVSNKERLKRQRKLDWSSSVKRTKRKEELKRRKK
jgi:hypothetical protein